MLKLHTIMETTSATVFKLFNFTTCEGIFQTLNGHCVFLHDAAINSFSCFLGMYIILTNSWVFWILFTRPEDDDTSLSIILNLALADTFTGWMVIYDAVYNILQFTLYVECILRIGMFVCCSLASRFIVMLLTFERLIKISNTYTYRKYINITRAKVSLVMVWVLSTLVGLLPFFGWSSMNILHLCSFIRTMSDSYLAFILILHVTPFFFTLYAYIRMVAVVRRHASAIEQVWRGAGNRRSCTTRAVITTVIVVGVYFVCWAPMGCFSVVVMTNRTDMQESGDWSEHAVFTYLLVLGVTNSALNPLIYAYKLDIVRRRFRVSLIYRCLKPCHELPRH